LRAILTSFLCPDSKILTQNLDSVKGVRSLDVTNNYENKITGIN